MEKRTLHAIDATSEQVVFPWVAQAARLTREVQGRKPETVLLLTSAPLERLSARQWLDANRIGWGAEIIHQKLDISHNEDSSRVRDPKAMLLLALFRRWSNSLQTHWISKHSKPKHATTTDFFTAMKANHFAKALKTIDSANPNLKPSS